MAQADWSALSDNAAATVLDNGVTSGTDKPAGGGTHVYGFRSLEATDSVVGYFTGQAGFVPTTKGGSIRGAIKRGPSSGPTGFAPFFFIGLQGTSIGDVAYILGLSDADPYHIVLRKGTLDTGVADGPVDPDGSDNVLMRSTEAFSDAEWLHLRMDMIVQGTGDVVLQIFQNDLDANDVAAPSWVVVPGMEGPQAPSIDGFVDDSLGINTGSVPLTAGRMGYGMRSQVVGATSFVDHLQCARQL